MKRLHAACRAVVFACCLLVLSGWSGTWDSLQRDAAGLTSVSARFTQAKNMRILARPLVSKGSFYYRAPDSVRWAYDEPVKSVLLMHSGTVRRYLQTDTGMVEDAGAALQAMNVVLQEITLWSRGRFNESPSFSAALKAGDRPAIVLVPRDAGFAKIIHRIDIVLAPDRPGVIKTMTIDEGEGGTTVFTFSDVQLNAPLEDSLFRRP